MSSTNDQHSETGEMKRLKQEIDRAEREIEKQQKKLDFETNEHQNRKNKLLRIHDGELKDLERRHQTQLQHLMNSGNTDIERVRRHVEELQRNREKYQLEKQSVITEIERRHKTTKKSDDKEAGSAQNDVNRSPEILRINERIERTNRELAKYQNELQKEQVHTTGDEDRLRRTQAHETEKLKSMQDNQLKDLEEGWHRTQKSLQSHITTYTTMKERKETTYKDQKRQFETEAKRREDLESRRRAQHGDDDANKDYSKIDGDHVLEEATDKDKRRMGAPRW